MLRVPPLRKSRIIASNGNHIETFELPPQMMPKVDIIKQTRSSLLNGSQSPVPSIQLPSIDLFKIMQVNNTNTAVIGDDDDASFWSMLAISPRNSTSSVLISDSNASRNSDTPVSAFKNCNLNSPSSLLSYTTTSVPPLLRSLSEQPPALVLCSPSLRNKHLRSGIERSSSFRLSACISSSHSAAGQVPSIFSQPVHNRSSSLSISSSSLTNDAHRCSKKHCV